MGSGHRRFPKLLAGAVGGFWVAGFCFAAPSFAEDAFKIGKKTYKVSELRREDESAFYEIEKQKYQLIQQQAQQKFLDHHWSEVAKQEKITAEEAMENFFEKNVKVSNAEVKEAVERFKAHPQLSRLTPAERENEIRNSLISSRREAILGQILTAGVTSGSLQILYPAPKEPIFKLTVTGDDPVRYGPEAGDTKPMGCEGDKCLITVIEYSEFECPYCARVLPSVKRLMKEYQGKVRWIVRDWPLSFHERARPAAVAAHCARLQGKYWEMYLRLFDNQRALSDADLKKYARSIEGLDHNQWNTCFENPGAVAKIIDKNFQSGQRYGVTGTPSFFINGRRLSGAIPYEDFRDAFEEELAKLGKSKS